MCFQPSLSVCVCLCVCVVQVTDVSGGGDGDVCGIDELPWNPDALPGVIRQPAIIIHVCVETVGPSRAPAPATPPRALQYN